MPGLVGARPPVSHSSGGVRLGGVNARPGAQAPVASNPFGNIMGQLSSMFGPGGAPQVANLGSQGNPQGGGGGGRHRQQDQWTTSAPPPPPIPAQSYDPNMQQVYGQSQQYLGDLGRNQDLAAQGALSHQRDLLSGMSKELGASTLLQQGAGGNRTQQLRQNSVENAQSLGSLNANLANAARDKQAQVLGMLGNQAGSMAGQAQSAQGQAYGQQFQNWQAPLQLQQQGQSLNLQAQGLANQAAQSQAQLALQQQQMQQQAYLQALGLMSGMYRG